jgi:hypothetical protein
MNNINVNPSVSFYESYKENILGCRESLFLELDKTSPDFGKEARKILDAKLQSNNNPLMGELFPWIIKDLIDGDNLITHKISVGWLAIYLYTLFLDEYVDNPHPLDSKKFITGSLLAKEGLLKIAHFTCNTPYESFVNDSLTHSALNQQLDVKYQNKRINSKFKDSYSEGKNYVVLACAGALAAQNSKYADFIIQFTQRLLLTFQYLDDLSDYYEDFHCHNFSVLLNDAFQDNLSYSQLSKSYSKTDILNKLIDSGSLAKVTRKIISFLQETLSFVDDNKLIEKTSEKSSVKFINELVDQCLILNNYLIYPSKDRADFLRKIEKQIIIIAEGT